MKYSTVAIIFNPNSTGASEKMAKQFAKKLEAKMPEQKIELIATEYAGHAEELAYELAVKHKKPLVISSSGDGGYHEVVNGLMKAQNEGHTPLASLLPAGNANDHYRNLYKKDLVTSIAEGSTTEIDILELTSKSEGKNITRFAHSYIGFGLTPDIGEELNKNKLNVFNQVWIVTKALFTIRPVRLVYPKKPRTYDSIIISNVDEMSKVLKISQPSDIHDGKFEVTIFKRRNKLELIALLLQASLTGVKEDLTTDKFSLKTIKAINIQADGEIIKLDAHTKVAITVSDKPLCCVI